MTKTELLDHFAVNAMKAQIEKMGITNPFSTAQTAYCMAVEMLEHRERILREWQKEQEMQHKQQNSDIKDLDLPIRYHRCLVSENILMKQDLSNWTEREVRRIPMLCLSGVEGRALPHAPCLVVS